MSGMNYAHMVAKPLVIAAAAYGISYFQTKKGQQYDVELLGMDVPVPMAQAAASFVGSMAAEFAHSTIFPLVDPRGRVWAAPMSEVVAVGTSAAVGAAFLTVGTGDSSIVSELGLVKLGITAVGAELVGSYLYDHFIGPMIFQQADPAFGGQNGF